MNIKFLSVFLVVVLASFGIVRPANAQWVVIDPTSLTQELIQVQQIAQEITLAQKTLTQVEQAYNSTTGNRGMQNLLSGVNRNYLPTNWTQLTGAMGGGGGVYGALGTDITSTVTRNAILTPSQTAQLSSTE